MRNRRHIALMFLSMILPGLFAFAVAAHRRPAAEAESAGPVGGVVAVQSSVDVGTIFSGSGVHATFRLLNQNARPIHIDSITSDCGCTVPEISDATIAPQRELEIPVSYFPPEPQIEAGFAFQRNIIVHFRAPSGDWKLPLSLTGFVAADRSLRIFPLIVDMGDLRAGDSHTRILHLKGDATIVDSIPDSIAISPGQSLLVPTPAVPAKSTAPIHQRDICLLVSVPAGAPSGAWTAAIRFTPDADSAGLSVGVNGSTLARVSASVSSIILSADGQSTASVQLFSTDGSALEQAHIETDLPLQYHFADLAPGRCSLHLALKPGSHFQGAGRVRIIFARNGNPTDSIALPVVIFGGESPQ